MKIQRRKIGVAGSLQNQMMGNNATEPKVGEHATILMYSDRYPYEVIAASDGKCTIRAMETNFIGQCYGDERYDYRSNPNGEVLELEWMPKTNRWCTVSTKVEVIRSKAKAMYKEHGWGWSDHLPDGVVRPDDSTPFRQYNLVKGWTKEYRYINTVSVIFGVCEKYVDPHF